MKKHIQQRLRESEDIKHCEQVKAWVGHEARDCYLTIVYNRASEFELALFLFKPSRMFLLNNKIDLLTTLPITRELILKQRSNGFSFRWLTYSETQYEIKCTEPNLYNYILNHIEEASIYQREPFNAGSPTHQWLWYYQESIPNKLKETKTINKVIGHRTSVRFQPEHFGKEIMTSYIKEQLTKRQSEYMLFGEIQVFIGTWNCGGTAPGQEIIKWLKGNQATKKSSDIIIICLQEMCALSAKNILGDENREESWTKFISQQLEVAFVDDQFSIIFAQSLVGLLTIVFVKTALRENIHNISGCVIKLGLKGYTGNKGAIATRFEYLNTSICTINCHLAAHKSKVKDRNKHVKSILKKTKFNLHGREIKIYENDHIFWIGDLNYRLQGLSSSSLRAMIESNDLKTLLTYDQLNNQKLTEKILFDFFEANILFPPTYKYIKGSSSYAEKREPSWCDRILCRGAATFLKYEACADIMQSDHKPIIAEFVVPVKLIRGELKKKVKHEIIKEINTIYQTAKDAIVIKPEAFMFERVFYKCPQNMTLTITNNSNSPIVFNLSFDVEASWLKLSNETGKVLPHESQEITLNILINEKNVHKANYYQNFLFADLNITIFNNLEKSIPVQIDFARSCFGCYFEDLLKIIGPVSLVEQPIHEFSKSSECKLDLPKELYSLGENLKISTSDFTDLFDIPADPLEIERIRLSLDKLVALDKHARIQSIWKVIIELFENLPKPFIIVKSFDKFIEDHQQIGKGSYRKKAFEIINSDKAKIFEYILDICAFIYTKCNDLIEVLIEDLLYPLLQIKQKSKEEALNYKRKLYLKLLILENN